MSSYHFTNSPIAQMCRRHHRNSPPFVPETCGSCTVGSISFRDHIFHRYDFLSVRSNFLHGYIQQQYAFYKDEKLFKKSVKLKRQFLTPTIRVPQSESVLSRVPLGELKKMQFQTFWIQIQNSVKQLPPPPPDKFDTMSVNQNRTGFFCRKDQTALYFVLHAVQG